MMLEWVTVILLIIIGLVLIIIELVFIPGTTLIGILGFVLAGAGIWFGYATLGTPIGHVILGLSVLISGLAFFYSFRGDSWSRFALKDSIDSRVNEEYQHNLEVGQMGLAASALRPQGTALFNDHRHEVQTKGEFISPNTTIRIIKLSQHKIIVEAVT
ncbi:MAG TPA: NfeD family protein [Pontibacter sp.]